MWQGQPMMTADQKRPTPQVAGLTSQLLCRVRPCDRPSPLVLISEAEAKVEVAPEKGHPGEPLLFHQVLTAQAQSTGEQEALFQAIRPAIMGGIEGQSSTIVAYGGPQSGKTYALSGFFTHAQLHGLAPRAINLIVETVEKLSTSNYQPANAPVIEASFFELGQDVVYDLVPTNLPKVGMQELSRFPYVKMDEKLTAIRCDGQAGYNRLLDTYFTGLEHRRKGTHTCFQITFVHEDRSAPGRPPIRSYLRFVEMAWPRSLTSVSAPSGGHSSLVGGAAAKSKASLAQDRTVASLDQVLQCKLSGSGTPPYRCSPLVLLLKPCFEGASLLNFIYCMRLEHSHLCSLALAAPLLSKLHTWLNRAPPVREEALAASMPRPGLSNAPIVPPLQLQAGEASIPHRQPAEQPALGADEESSCCTSDCGSPDGDSSITIPRTADADAGAGAHETSTGSQAEQLALLEKLAHQPPIDTDKMMRDLALLLEVKQRSTQMLQADAERSAVVLENLSAVLTRLRVKREACQEHGPCEKETNLRLLFEKVSRSLQRSQVEIAKMYEDIEVIAQFCQGGAVAPAYESYSVTEEDVQKIMDHMMVDVGPPRPAGASATAPAAPPAGAQPQQPPEDNVIRIPQLPLSLLAQEAVDIQLQDLGGNVLSPSSASSCSELDVSANTMPRKGLSAYVDVGRSPGLVARSVNYVQNVSLALPHTPPNPSRMVLGHPQQHSLICAPTMFAPHAGQQLGLGHVFQVPKDEGDTSQHGNSVLVPVTDLPSQTPGYGGYLHEANRSISAQQGLATAFPVQVQVTSQDDDLQSRLRKSRSTNALMGRSLSTTAINAVALSGAGSGPPPVRAPVGSPLMGHRSTLSSVSPMRGAFTGSTGQSATAPVNCGLGQSASMSALPGNAPANMVVPKRSIMQSSAASRGPQRPQATIMPHALAGGEVQPPHAPVVARQSTPVPQPSKGQEVRSRGSGGSAAQTHSPSPAMMRRSVSTQALRFDRPVAGGGKPGHHEKAIPRGHAPGGPSPERQRPTGAIAAVPSGPLPVRAMSPALRSSQRQV